METVKKYILLLLLALVLPTVAVYAWFTLTSGHHDYTQDDTFSFRLFTPANLKKLPFISNHSVYTYDYNTDNQQTRVIISWADIENIYAKKKELETFLKMLNGFNKYDCSWIYNDKNNSAENYQRYCIFQKGKILELEYVET
jgi:hypothetical protein